MAVSSSQKPIFLQALWRTHSTFWWNVFRQDEGIRAYYEPFHEDLWCRTRSELQAQFAKQSKKFRHSDVSEYYFAEYPIQQNGGVPNFLRRAVLERYHIPFYEEDAQLERYSLTN